MWTVTTDRPFHPDRDYFDYETMPRDEYGVPAHIPPDLSTVIKHTYCVPPQYFPFLKKLGDETPEIKPMMDKLIAGQLTFEDYEELFYKNSKPLKIYRNRIPMPFRTEAEVKKEAEVAWESAWISFRQRVAAEYTVRYVGRDLLLGMMLGLWFTQLWMTQMVYTREDMKLFYLEAPEHKINWVVARGDL